MNPFYDFEQSSEEITNCAACLNFVQAQIKEALTDDLGDLSFDHRGMITTLDMLVLRLEEIANDIDKSVKFHESPDGEQMRKGWVCGAGVNK